MPPSKRCRPVQMHGLTYRYRPPRSPILRVSDNHSITYEQKFARNFLESKNPFDACTIWDYEMIRFSSQLCHKHTYLTWNHM